MLMTAQDFDPETHAGPLPSPCINLCQMDQASGLCRGCWRTLPEIIAWSRASENDKCAMWQEIKRRASQNR